MLTKDELNELFRYAEGELFWKKSRSGIKDINKPAGYVRDHKYRYIQIKGRSYLAHRLIWVWHGKDLPEELDHINGDKSDNRLENLRPASRVENLLNFGSKGGTSKFRGVYLESYSGKWRAEFRRKFLGRFEKEEDAAKAWNIAASNFSKDFPKLNGV